MSLNCLSLLGGIKLVPKLFLICPSDILFSLVFSKVSISSFLLISFINILLLLSFSKLIAIFPLIIGIF